MSKKQDSQPTANALLPQFETVSGQIEESTLSDEEKQHLGAAVLAATGILNKKRPGASTLLMAQHTLTTINIALSKHAEVEKERTIAEQNHKLAYIDPLTGLPNKRALDPAYKRIIDHIKDEKLGSATIIAVDANDFRTVNNYFGHNTGDRALERYATIMKTIVPDSDIVARVGGDEFVIIIEHRKKKPDDTDENWVSPNAEKIINDIRTAISKEVLVSNERPDERNIAVPLGLSFGLSTIDPNKSLKENKTKADLAAYAEKQKAEKDGGIYAEIKKQFVPLKQLPNYTTAPANE